MSIGSFREDARDYLAVCQELYSDLSINERTIPNDKVDEKSDVLAKAAISELACEYLQRSRCSRSNSSVSKSRENNQNCNEGDNYKNVNSSLERKEDFRTFYADTLKMLITDLERKDIWQVNTMFSDKVSTFT